MELISEREEKILANQGLVHIIVNEINLMQYKYLDYNDSVSIGMIGLIKAVDTFDESKEVKFATYASRCIRNELLMEYRKNKKLRLIISLEEAFGSGEVGSLVTISQNWKEDACFNYLEKIENRESFIEIMSILLNCLKEKNKIIILYSIGGVNQTDIAHKFNINQSHISRVIRKTINDIKQIVDKQETYKKVFLVDATEREYIISFSIKDIDNFNEAAMLMKNELLSNVNIDYNEEYAKIYLPNVPESFYLLAEILKKCGIHK